MVKKYKPASKAFLVSVLFEKMGFRTRLKSTKYLKDALLIHIDKPHLKISTGICPVLEKEYHVIPKNARALLDSAIKRGWKSCPQEVIKEITDHPLFTEQGKVPSTHEFFFLVRRWVLKNMQN